MSRLHGDDAELTDTDARIINGMIARGDKNETIAAYFGVNQRAVSHVRQKKKFAAAGKANPSELPPPGPYGVDPIYVRFYRTMTKVDQLWNELRLAEAKELLEQALKNPVFIDELDAISQISSGVFRDEHGLPKVT